MGVEEGKYDGNDGGGGDDDGGGGGDDDDGGDGDSDYERGRRENRSNSVSIGISPRMGRCELWKSALSNHSPR